MKKLKLSQKLKSTILIIVLAVGLVGLLIGYQYYSGSLVNKVDAKAEVEPGIPDKDGNIQLPVDLSTNFDNVINEAQKTIADINNHASQQLKLGYLEWAQQAGVKIPFNHLKRTEDGKWFAMKENPNPQVNQLKPKVEKK